MKETIKLGVVLFTITALCAGMLGFVNQLTSPVIEKGKETAKTEAMKRILPEADTFRQVEKVADSAMKELYIAYQGSSAIGYIGKIVPEGYGGGIELLVGVDEESKVKAVQILSHTETPGLGANATKPEYLDQYKEQNPPLNVVKGQSGEGEISAIAGATITSKAVTKGVNEVCDYVAQNKEQLREEGTK